MLLASFLSFGLFSGKLLALGSAVCLLVIGAGLVTGRRHRSGTAPAAPAMSIHPADLEANARFELSALMLRGERLDAASQVRWVLAAVRPQAEARHVRLEAAVRPGLAVWLDPRAFRKLMVDIVGQAVAAAPGGKVLVTGGEHGGRAQLAVVHDGPAPERGTVELALRSATEIVAFHGGSLEVDVRPGQGVTAIVRLPAFVGAPTRATAAGSAGLATPRSADGAVTEALLGSS